MILIGTTGRTSTVESGSFHCPGCGPEKAFDLKQIRRWFTLYLIPTIPLDVAGRFIECQACGGQFEEEMRDYDPEQFAARFRSLFNQTMLRAMLVMARSDGAIEHGEKEAIAKIMSELTDGEYETDDIDRASAMSAGDTLKRVLAEAEPQLNVDGKVLLLQALVRIAAADGRIESAEEKTLLAAGRQLGFPKRDIKRFLSDAKAEL